MIRPARRVRLTARPRRGWRFGASLALLGSVALVACRYDWPLGAADGGAAAGDDGGGVGEGGDVDALGGGEGGPVGFCSGATFCDTFDDAPIKPHWSDTFLGSSGSSLRIEPFDAAVSAPNVLFAGRTVDGGNPGTAYATKVIELPITRATLSFAFRPELYGGTARACVAGIVFNDGAADSHLARILMGKDSAILQEKTPNLLVHPLSATPAVGAWTHVVLSVEVGGNIAVTLDGTKVLDVAADPSWTKSTTTRIVLGINFSEDVAAAFGLHFDDVRFDGT